MKKIEIFGKKVPLFAILIAIMVIGTASAAVFYNYATLRGDIEVTNSISVSDHNTSPIALGGDGELIFTSPATFVVNNNGEEPVVVDLVTTIFLDAVKVTDEAGLTVDYSVIDGTDVERGLVLVPPGGLTIDVEFDAVDNAVPGTYTVQVEVNYSGEAYETFTGDNAIESIDLMFKTPSWSPIVEDGSITVKYVPMGNEFVYSLTSNDVTIDDYALIYYADFPDRFELYGGDNPGAVIVNNVDMIPDDNFDFSTDLGIDMPDPQDANYDTTYTNYTEVDGYENACGAKLWMIPSSHLSGDNTTLPMDVWSQPVYLMETELIHYIDTDKL